MTSTLTWIVLLGSLTVNAVLLVWVLKAKRAQKRLQQQAHDLRWFAIGAEKRKDVDGD